MTPERNHPNIAVVIVAAGRGERSGSALPKQYHRLAGETVLARTVRAFRTALPGAVIQTVIADGDIRHFRDAVAHDEEYQPSAALRNMIEERLEGMKPAVEREGDSPVFVKTKTGAAPRRWRWTVLAVTSAAVLLLAVSIPSLPMFRHGTPSEVAMEMAPESASSADAPAERDDMAADESLGAAAVDPRVFQRFK